MIAMGFVARNFFEDAMKPYPAPWTAWIRGFCLCILLIRGGLQVSFTGKGLIVVLMSFIPQFFEATAIALVAHGLFDMPFSVSYTLGYNLACISPSIIVPGLMSLNERGYGREKNFAGTMIASGTFDDIICIICFGICKAIALNFAGLSGGKSMGMEIGILFIENIIALVVGVSFGLTGWFFKFVQRPRLRIYLKLGFCLVAAIFFVIVEEYAGSHDAKYIGALSFGYTCFRLWGEDKPAKEIAWFWFFMQPFLFGTVGGQLQLSKLRAGDLGNGFVIILIGLFVRYAAVMLVTQGSKFTIKERAFMGIVWVGKATVQAALSALFLTSVKMHPDHENFEEYEDYGNKIQTTAIFAIVICATTGSILLNSLGTTLLTQDIVEATPSKDEKKETCKDKEFSEIEV